MLTKHLSTILFAVAIVIVCAFPGHRALGQSLNDYRAGWSDLFTEVVGDDSSCGPSGNLLEVYVRDRFTNEPVTNVSVYLGVFNPFTSNNQQATYPTVSGNGPLVGSVCVADPVGSLIQIGVSSDQFNNIQLNRSFTNLYSQIAPVILPNIPQQKKLRMTIWMTPRSYAKPEYEFVSPYDGEATSTDPAYTVRLNGFPTLYGATGINNIRINVDQRSYSYSSMNWLRYKGLPLYRSGGVGEYRIPGTDLEDGMYAWDFNFTLNDEHTDHGYTIKNSVQSTMVQSAFFIVDRVAPTFASSSGTRVSEDGVVVGSGANDTLSGITEIKLYVDSALVKTCTYADTASAECVSDTITYENGEHTYFATVRDAAGNSATSSMERFTVNESPLPDFVSSTVSPTTVSTRGVTMFTASIGNTGSELTGRTIRDSLERADDPNGSNRTVLNNSVPHKVPGDTAIRYAVPPADTGTTIYLRVCADWTEGSTVGDVAESDETNNCGGWTPIIVGNQAQATGTISASSTTVSYNETTIVAWSTNSWNGEPCEVKSIPEGDEWTGNNNPGVVSRKLKADTTYVLSCGGTPVSSTQVTVNPDVEIHASLPVVKSGSEVTVSWDTKGNKESVCTLSGGGLSNSLFNGTGKGTATITVDNATLLKLTCGQKSDTEMVSIVPLSWES